MGLDRKKAIKVRVDKAKQPRSDSVGGEEGISMHLARETGFTDGIRRGWRIEFNTCSKARETSLPGSGGVLDDDARGRGRGEEYQTLQRG